MTTPRNASGITGRNGNGNGLCNVFHMLHYQVIAYYGTFTIPSENTVGNGMEFVIQAIQVEWARAPECDWICDALAFKSGHCW
jgi:hypothetical protein